MVLEKLKKKQGFMRDFVILMSYEKQGGRGGELKSGHTVSVHLRRMCSLSTEARIG